MDTPHQKPDVDVEEPIRKKVKIEQPLTRETVQEQKEALANLLGSLWPQFDEDGQGRIGYFLDRASGAIDRWSEDKNQQRLEELNAGIKQIKQYAKNLHQISKYYLFMKLSQEGKENGFGKLLKTAEEYFSKARVAFLSEVASTKTKSKAVAALEEMNLLAEEEKRRLETAYSQDQAIQIRLPDSSKDSCDRTFFDESTEFIDCAWKAALLRPTAPEMWKRTDCWDSTRRQALLKDVFKGAFRQNKYEQFVSLLTEFPGYQKLYDERVREYEQALESFAQGNEKCSPLALSHAESSEQAISEQKQLLLLLKENLHYFLHAFSQCWDFANPPDGYFERVREAWKTKLEQIIHAGTTGETFLRGEGLQRLDNAFNALLNKLVGDSADRESKYISFLSDRSTLAKTVAIVCDEQKESSSKEKKRIYILEKGRLFIRQRIFSWDCASAGGLMVLNDYKQDQFIRPKEFREALEKVYRAELFVKFEEFDKAFHSAILPLALPFVFKALKHPVTYTLHRCSLSLDDNRVASIIKHALHHRDAEGRTIPILLNANEHCFVIDQLRQEEDGQEILCIRNSDKKEPYGETIQSFVTAARENDDIHLVVPVYQQEGPIASKEKIQQTTCSLISYIYMRFNIVYHNYQFIMTEEYASGSCRQLKGMLNEIRQLVPLSQKAEEQLTELEKQFGNTLKELISIGDDKEARWKYWAEKHPFLYSSVVSLEDLILAEAKAARAQDETKELPGP